MYRILTILLLCLSASLMQAQIVVGGKVYGGGNKGDVNGKTKVTVRAGDLNAVYGGARMADVKGSALVNIDGEHASSYILINYVYGGNDISGTIGRSKVVPAELTEKVENGIDTTWNAFIRVSSVNTTITNGIPKITNNKVYIGQLFGGGNGDYDYTSATEEGVTTHYIMERGTDSIVASSTEDFNLPELGRTYLEIVGGSIVNAYGGGNNATVTDTTVICVDNPSTVVNSIKDTSGVELLTDDRIEKGMGINPGYSHPTSAEYQIGSFFGGNNKAEMAIRPVWNLKNGKIRNLYSGGNRGAMTSTEGLLLEIPETSTIEVGNLYGGCRMADVTPKYPDGTLVTVVKNLTEKDEQGNLKYHFPDGFSARVLVRGGHVTNVYGGNDVTGKVYGGNAVGIYTTVYGDVYGGGNGSYPYTDNSYLKKDPTYGDFYYDPGSSSVDSLDAFRPHAEQVSIRVAGKKIKDAVTGDSVVVNTIIHGGIFIGGNCATLKPSPKISNPTAELKIGSYVIADSVFLGNNGYSMVQYHEKDAEHHYEGVLRTLGREISTLGYTGEGANTKFNTMSLTGAGNVFEKYMNGVAMNMMPSVVFDDMERGDPADYEGYTSYFGSFFCGGNVGSIDQEGCEEINFSHKVIVFNKLVGGCNNAFVKQTDFNAAYDGGLIGAAEDGTGNKLVLNLSGLKIQPKRWNANGTGLIWNTISATTGEEVTPTGLTTGSCDDDDIDRRLYGGNIYGGCYNSGHIEGNVVINIDGTIVDRGGEFGVFDSVEQDEIGEAILYGNDSYTITERRSGVILDEQGMDVMGSALNVFGGGYGEDSEIWGSTTINLNKGYTFQIFGGGEHGAIGKGTRNALTGKISYDKNNDGKVDGSDYDSIYSTCINVHGEYVGKSKRDETNDDLAECEFIYGGGFEGLIVGDTRINLGNGRVFNTFAGSCNADILGHTETYVGQWTDSTGTTVTGFPWIRDHIYGGNDLGGRILGSKDFHERVSAFATPKVYNTDCLTASAYMEYTQGRVDNIFGGCYGDYNYSEYSSRVVNKPYMDNAFVYIHPTNATTSSIGSAVKKVFGAGQGGTGDRDGDKMQDRSYVLVDIPSEMDNFAATEVFGAGSFDGLGMRYTQAQTAAAGFDLDTVSAVIDLVSGQINAAYGGSYNEGITRRTVVNVPVGSTIKMKNVFGGAYGVNNALPCDVYEAIVNYSSEDAIVGGYRSGIYGGNNNCRRTLYGKVNVNVPVWYDKANGYLATVYGAGYGKDTWSEYTEVNLNGNPTAGKLGARVYEVYGGGQLGRVLNKKTVDAWKAQLDANNEEDDATHLYTDLDGYTNNGLVDDLATYKYNTNVRINQGAIVSGYMYNGSLSGAYAYGGGLGSDTIKNTGDVHGTTFVGLYGGKVVKDIYAAGTIGSVNNRYNVAKDDFNKDFIASTNAYIEGGTARNVYGGGWKGSVGYHDGEDITTSYADDIYGETNVIIGKLDGTSLLDGIPAIERNAYAGGEGGAVYGTANITLNKGYIGYRYFDTKPTDGIDYIAEGGGYYQEKLHDETRTDGQQNTLYDSGCIFGGGYIDHSSVDITNVKMYGGHVRNSVFGGGEIAAIGRGVIEVSGEDNSQRSLQGIYKAGKTHVTLFNGNVHRNVFGGGRGYNNLGEGGALYSDGFVFGQTEVYIHGGEVGTAKELALGNGNVFGGGDIGYVYSAYENAAHGLCIGQKDGERYDDQWEGYYYAREGGSYENGKYVHPNDPPNPATAEDLTGWVMDHGEYVLTEDCKVLVEPWCQVKEPVTIAGHPYLPGQYVKTDTLNTLGNKNVSSSEWEALDDDGIIIHNAVFAGGNTSSGSSKVYANVTSVFGNATASIHDVYHRDLITVGTGHTGGLYGDGNLTFVDGYRGLNITNYGTDYYTIQKEISIADYHNLPNREAAYYELRYKCLKSCTDKDGTLYMPASTDASGGSTSASTISADDLLTLFENIKEGNDSIIVINEEGEKVPNPDYWEENGVCSRYAGRIMNTIQRADFCGVFGSRMVMQGARDRVPEIVDYTNYTINRVREVSLNQQHSVIPGDLTPKQGTTSKPTEEMDFEDYADGEKAVHGNYFGIYNIVNFLGALSSDVHFSDKRYTDNTSDPTYKEAITVDGNEYAYGDDNATFYNWKKVNYDKSKRNNGRSLNKVALASGVYLELTTEKSTGTDVHEKEWGHVTGIIELDLINVQPGIGGGFVYAKNEHRTWTYNKKHHVTLTSLNKDAVTQQDFDYSTTLVPWETSGNFIHSTQTIIDDCYNISGKYEGGDAVPAHYWYIKGSVYVYDQYISAYTGAPNAYSETVEIPLTITAASHGSMKLLNIMPNLYAYYSSPGKPLEDGKKIVINDVTYYKNDPISYWDWYLLSKSEKELFEKETYVTTAECTTTVGTTKFPAGTYPAGTVLLPEDYEALRNLHKPTTGNSIPVHHSEKNQEVDFDFVFRSSNNMSHNTGYLLTYTVNNPKDWNTWYTKFDSSTHEKKSTETYNNETGYNNGPTYYLNSGTGGLLGQRHYDVSNVISKDIYTTYQAAKDTHPEAIPTNDTESPDYDATKKQAVFEPAFIVTQEVTITEPDGSKSHFNPGAIVSATKAQTLPSGSVDSAYISTTTISLSKTELIYLNARMSKAEKEAYYNSLKDEKPALARDIKEYVLPAYYCTEEGLYGGNYYESGKNYRALEVWSSMSAEDRQQFSFNYDALDLLIDSLYSMNEAGTQVIHPEGKKYQYDGLGFTTEDQAKTNPAGYSLAQPIDYTASYMGSSNLSLTDSVKVMRNNVLTKTNEVREKDELPREEYEKIPNEQRNYTSIVVEEAGTYYVVNTSFQVGNSTYAVGTTMAKSTYDGLGDSQTYVTPLTFTTAHKGKTYFYCRESYKVGKNGEGVSVTNVSNVSGSKTGTYVNGDTVPVGLVIDATTYGQLPNKQKNFLIHGIAPTETSTLYVSRNSDIFDLSQEKIITVIYEYNYEESDASGNITPVSERHVVNIHVMFKSGAPRVEDIKAPRIVIPGDYVGLREPTVTPGAYEVTGGGWELFEKISDVENHTNGIEYIPGAHPLYWYQDGYYVAYYAKTYLGKSYSNHVQVHVANYHDLKKVMDDKEHHYYVDIPDLQRLKRDPKIYISDYGTGSQNSIDMLKSLYELSLLDESSAGVTNGVVTADGALKNHALLDNQVKECQNLEFFLASDIDHSGLSWTPIANEDGQCFEGTLHGDGHTISGLQQTLFGHLCGDVYNLGVTGSFTGAGIAEAGSGYVENSWISTSSTAVKTSKPVFDTPTIESNTTRPYRIVNCYYQEEDTATNKYTNHSGDYGIPTHKPKQFFYNGEVAYDLNGFYLFKRYCNEKVATGTEHKFYTIDAADNTLVGPQAKYYGSHAYLSSVGYVESRFADGDFIYAQGEIPETSNERLYTDATTGETAYYPIWPDDYFFFGQSLNYDHVDGRTHQDYPSSINRSNNRVESADNSNRVYRAPAYFQSGKMGVAHFNRDAVFAQTKNGDATVEAYKNMTAIDFTGGNGDVTGGYQLGSISAAPYQQVKDGAFYPPLLDDAGLTSFQNIDLTRNLLAYTGTSTAAATKTNNVVSAYLQDEAYAETNSTYRTVAYRDPAHVHGHWVQLLEGDYIAQRDHLLVDEQDFNSPIGYDFAEGKRMWYQRTPANFVDRVKGWENVCLPFTAELMTTNVKGELTHFYDGSTTGHEYWLREFKGNLTQKKDGEGHDVEGVYVADFDIPEAGSTSKTVGNTFLWDYYYEGNHSQQDANEDMYPEGDTYRTYYRSSRLYADYSFMQHDTPYLIGFPGVTYYEFDLSGNFLPKTTALTKPVQLKAQMVTFASEEGTSIGVTDTQQEAAAAQATYEGYTFMPNSLNRTFAAGTENIYTLASDGGSYAKIPAASDDPEHPVAPTVVSAFRPYFVKAASGNHASPRKKVDYIVFNQKNNSSFAFEDEDPTQEDMDGELVFYVKKRILGVKSTLSNATDVAIINPSGLTIASFTIQPGETVETRVPMKGVYIIRAANGRYTKKIVLR